jgi:hypothetical protein
MLLFGWLRLWIGNHTHMCPLTRSGHSVLTEPIGSVLRFSVKFGSQQIRTEYRTVRFGSFSFLTEGTERGSVIRV